MFLRLPNLQQQLLSDLNWLRSCPAQLCSLLTSRLQLYQGSYLFSPSNRSPLKTLQGSFPLQQLISQLSLLSPLPQLIPSSGLCKAATTHAYQFGEPTYPSNPPQDKLLEDRLRLYCNVTGKALELIQLSGVDSKQILFELLIDDGLVSRSRRKALLNPRFGYVGIGVARNRRYGQVTVIVLAESVEEVEVRVPIYQVQPQTFEINVLPPPVIVEEEYHQIVVPETVTPVYEQVQVSGLVVPRDVVEVRPNRLLYAQTYQKNVFGGENQEFCLLF